MRESERERERERECVRVFVSRRKKIDKFLASQSLKIRSLGT